MYSLNAKGSFGAVLAIFLGILSGLVQADPAPKESYLRPAAVPAPADNQVTPEEKAWAYAQLASSEAFNRRICELRKIRDLIRLAYRELSMPGQDRVTPSVKAAGR